MTGIEREPSSFYPGKTEALGMVLLSERADEMLYEVAEAPEVRPFVKARADYAGTLNHGDYEGKPASDWRVSRKLMTGSNPEKHAELGAHYGALEDAGELTFQESYDWNDRAGELIKGIDYDEFLKVLMARTIFKNGFLSFIDNLKQGAIPLEIVSSGFEQTIEAGLASKRVAVGGLIRIYANRLQTATFEEKDEDTELVRQITRITGVAPPIVHSLNKHTFPTAEQATDEASSRPHGAVDMILGDKPHDVLMSNCAPEDRFAICADGSLIEILRKGGPKAVRRHAEVREEAGYDAIAIAKTLRAPNRVLARNLEIRGIRNGRAA